MVVEDVQSDQDDIDGPPDTAETSSDELEDTEEDVTEIETIDAKGPRKMESMRATNQLRSETHMS